MFDGEYTKYVIYAGIIALIAVLVYFLVFRNKKKGAKKDKFEEEMYEHEEMYEDEEPEEYEDGEEPEEYEDEDAEDYEDEAEESYEDDGYEGAASA